jgi:adenylate cyclase
VLKPLLLGIVVSIAVTLLSQIGALAGWQTRVVDAFLFLRERQPEPEIALVTIDEDAFRSLGERQPLPRRYLADLADFLFKSGARVVTFDVTVKAKTDDGDAALIAVARRAAAGANGRLVFASTAQERPEASGERYEMDRAFSTELHALFGFSNTPIGSDGVIRRMAPVLPAVGGGFLPSLALATLASWDVGTPGVLDAALRSGGALRLPTSDAHGRIAGLAPVSIASLDAAQWRIDYAGPPGTFTAFPSGPLVQMARGRAEPAADNPFRGKIVLVGASFAESRDFHNTPVGLMTGVEIQAHMLHTLLARRMLRPPHWSINLALLVLVCVAVALLSLRLRGIWLTVTTLAIVAVSATVSYEAYVRGGYWLDFIGPLLAMRLYRQTSNLLERRRVRSAFGQYVSVAVLDRVVRDGTDLGGDVRTVSVLMSDVRNFTSLAEGLPPAEVSQIMSEYFAAMIDVIMEHGGTVSDFIGDGILAVFGAPLADPEHAWHAVETALGMQAVLRTLNEQWVAEDRPALAMGVAVNTGEVFAGNIGSARKMKYTVMGDTVNTVARIEALNRDLGTEILIGAATLAAVGERIRVRDRGEVTVKGKIQAVTIFELDGLA